MKKRHIQQKYKYIQMRKLLVLNLIDDYSKDGEWLE